MPAKSISMREFWVEIGAARWTLRFREFIETIKLGHGERLLASLEPKAANE